MGSVLLRHLELTKIVITLHIYSWLSSSINLGDFQIFLWTNNCELEKIYLLDCNKAYRLWKEWLWSATISVHEFKLFMIHFITFKGHGMSPKLRILKNYVYFIWFNIDSETWMAGPFSEAGDTHIILKNEEQDNYATSLRRNMIDFSHLG